MGIWLDWCDKGDIEDGDSPVRLEKYKFYMEHYKKDKEAYIKTYKRRLLIICSFFTLLFASLIFLTEELWVLRFVLSIIVGICGMILTLYIEKSDMNFTQEYDNIIVTNNYDICKYKELIAYHNRLETIKKYTLNIKDREINISKDLYKSIKKSKEHSILLVDLDRL